MKKITKILSIIMLCTFFLQTTIYANTVEFKGGSEGLISAPDDFFSNFDELMPGDVEEDFAYIKNSTEKPVEIYFRTEPLEKAEYYDEVDYSLLEKIKLTINIVKSGSSEQEQLYEGNLGAESMKEFVSLGQYTQGYDGKFIFKIEVPKELKNKYTLSRTKVKWIFAVEEFEEENKEEENTDKPNNQNQENTEEKNPIQNIIEKVKTGDKVYIAIGIFLVALVVLILLVLIQRRKKNEEKN